MKCMLHAACKYTLHDRVKWMSWTSYKGEVDELGMQGWSGRVGHARVKWMSWACKGEVNELSMQGWSGWVGHARVKWISWACKVEMVQGQTGALRANGSDFHQRPKICITKDYANHFKLVSIRAYYFSQSWASSEHPRPVCPWSGRVIEYGMGHSRHQTTLTWTNIL